MSERMGLKCVGYWGRGYLFDKLPWPQRLVGKPRKKEEVEQIVAYLLSGHIFAGWMGYSYCRFNCGVDDAKMGYTDRTDGEWVWPAGLAHYIVEHNVMLPDAFITTMRNNNWKIPRMENPPEFGPELNFDFTFWLQWSKKHQRRSWFVFW